MKQFFALIFFCTSLCSYAGIGGIGGGSSSISINELRSFLKAKNIQVEVPKLTFTNEEFGGTLFVPVSDVCHREKTFETFQTVMIQDPTRDHAPAIVLNNFKLVRNRLNRIPQNSEIPLEQPINIYKVTHSSEPEKFKQLIGAKIFTIPECETTTHP
jgi:hypothetical protein